MSAPRDGLPRTTDGIRRAGQLIGQGVVAVQADEDHAVDVAGREVAHGPLLIDVVIRHEQHELEVAHRQRRADTANEPREERVTEQPICRLRDDDRDRIAAARDEAPGGAVRDVPEAVDRLLDRASDVGADLRGAVDDPGNGRAGDTGDARHLIERGDRSTRAGLELRHGSPGLACSVVRALSRSGTDHITPCQESAYRSRPGRFSPRDERCRPRYARLFPMAIETTRGDTTGTPALDRYEAVIGIEVHCQLRTESKMFCSCATAYDGAAPNTHVCPVCLGLPGALPVINRRAVEHVLATGIAIEATTPEATRWDRKNYFYPDLPKGYQISQYDLPLASARAADDRDVGRAVHDRDHPRPPRGGHGQARARDDRRRTEGQPGRLQPLRRTADGDRHRS